MNKKKQYIPRVTISDVEEAMNKVAKDTTEETVMSLTETICTWMQEGGKLFVPVATDIINDPSSYGDDITDHLIIASPDDNDEEYNILAYTDPRICNYSGDVFFYEISLQEIIYIILDDPSYAGMIINLEGANRTCLCRDYLEAVIYVEEELYGT